MAHRPISFDVLMPEVPGFGDINTPGQRSDEYWRTRGGAPSWQTVGGAKFLTAPAPAQPAAQLPHPSVPLEPGAVQADPGQVVITRMGAMRLPMPKPPTPTPELPMPAAGDSLASAVGRAREVPAVDLGGGVTEYAGGRIRGYDISGQAGGPTRIEVPQGGPVTMAPMGAPVAPLPMPAPGRFEPAMVGPGAVPAAPQGVRPAGLPSGPVPAAPVPAQPPAGVPASAWRPAEAADRAQQMQVMPGGPITPAMVSAGPPVGPAKPIMPGMVAPAPSQPAAPVAAQPPAPAGGAPAAITPEERAAYQRAKMNQRGAESISAADRAIIERVEGQPQRMADWREQQRQQALEQRQRQAGANQEVGWAQRELDRVLKDEDASDEDRARAKADLEDAKNRARQARGGAAAPADESPRDMEGGIGGSYEAPPPPEGKRAQASFKEAGKNLGAARAMARNVDDFMFGKVRRMPAVDPQGNPILDENGFPTYQDVPDIGNPPFIPGADRARGKAGSLTPELLDRARKEMGRRLMGTVRDEAKAAAQADAAVVDWMVRNSQNAPYKDAISKWAEKNKKVWDAHRGAMSAAEDLHPSTAVQEQRQLQESMPMPAPQTLDIPEPMGGEELAKETPPAPETQPVHVLSGEERAQAKQERAEAAAKPGIMPPVAEQERLWMPSSWGRKGLTAEGKAATGKAMGSERPAEEQQRAQDRMTRADEAMGKVKQGKLPTYQQFVDAVDVNPKARPADAAERGNLAADAAHPIRRLYTLFSEPPKVSEGEKSLPMLSTAQGRRVWAELSNEQRVQVVRLMKQAGLAEMLTAPMDSDQFKKALAAGKNYD